MEKFWLRELFEVKDRKVKDINGLDAYMFVRFLRMMVYIFAPIWLVSWLVLLPVDSVDTDSGKTGLDRFTFGNISTADQSRYWTHLVCAWGFTIYICIVLWLEMREFIGLRQTYLTDPKHCDTPQAKTILITGIPPNDLTDSQLTYFFDVLPGGVKHIWINRDLKDLPSVYDDRMKACQELEKLETKLIHTAVKLRAKELEKAGKAEKMRARDTKATKTGRAIPPSSSGPGSDSKTRSSVSTSTRPITHSGDESMTERSSDLSSSSNDSTRKRETTGTTESTYATDSSRPRETTDTTEFTSTTAVESSDYRGKSGITEDTDLERGKPSLTLAERLVPEDMRPKKSLPRGPLPFAVPFLSTKVDGITWCREEIQKTTKILEKERKVMRDQMGEGHGRVGGAAGLYTKGTALIKRARKRQRAEHEKQREKEKKLKYPALNSAFIMFNKQISAHLAMQSLVHSKPFAMSKRYIEVAPGDVIWGNLGLDPKEMRTRSAISFAITAGLIIVWSIPVAFIGAISNISNLCDTVSWLSWLCNIPGTALGFIEGVLPTVLLTVLMMLLPIFLRLLARFEGKPTYSSLELSLMTRYFCFQVIVSPISSSILTDVDSTFSYRIPSSSSPSRPVLSLHCLVS